MGTIARVLATTYSGAAAWGTGAAVNVAVRSFIRVMGISSKVKVIASPTETWSVLCRLAVEHLTLGQPVRLIPLAVLLRRAGEILADVMAACAIAEF